MKINRVTRAVGVAIAFAFVAFSGPRLFQNGGGSARESASLSSLAASAQQVPVERAAANPLRNAYFGDLHVHSSWSSDAYGSGNRSDPRMAYRFGRGEAITLSTGVRTQLRVPLDFMAMTDHDSVYADVPLCLDPSDSFYGSPACRDYLTRPWTAPRTIVPCTGPRDTCSGSTAGVWRQLRVEATWRMTQRNADEFYAPGRFTTFPAYEFTGGLQGMLHRNVIFRGGKLPETILRAGDVKSLPEPLWEWLEHECTGECQVVSIPHNSNWNQGIMLGTTNADGTPFTLDGLKRRAAAEYLVEIYQNKGESECQLSVGTTDEECNFEQSHKPCPPGQKLDSSGGMPVCAVESQFVRNAAKTGLLLEGKYGVNPYKFGFIGSTDTHSSTPGATEEDDFKGAFAGYDDTPEERRSRRRWPPAEVPGNRYWGEPILPSSGGLAGVWAEENTRESIFAALRRREVFATSGTRIRVRFFGGWTLSSDLAGSNGALEVAYKDGVAMGGDLPSRPPEAKSPRFSVWATKDPNDANIQKIQVIKGWAVGDQTFERTYDVACADQLSPDAKTGRCRDNGATVNLSDCTYSSTKGARDLSTTWVDPEFDPAQRAFYYARVLQNPTCRWTTYDAIRTKVAPPEGVPATIKERAWSSPIWYTPPSR